MNERVMRLPGKHAAQFITAFDETKSSASDSAVWLVWDYEGAFTLYDLLQVGCWCGTLDTFCWCGTVWGRS